ncbi:MAG: 6-pyruvoyl-tetrahydropterin synthase-related protein [bacterium]
MRAFIKSHAPYLLAITFIVMFLTRNLWGTRAWIETHDGIFHLIRQEVFTDVLRTGQFPVRWASSLDNGFGLPLFNYIYPGPYYLGSPLSLLGLSSKWVIKAVEIGLYLVGGFGMYFLLFRKNKLFATVAAIFYLTTPYFLLNIFVRGALGEFMAISFMPWILLSLQDLSVRKGLRWYHPLPYFFMFIAHNFLSFLFLPIYFLVVMQYRKIWKTSIASLVLSLGLAAFFVLPMLLERNLLFSVTNQNFTYNYLDHFVYPIQLIYGKWGNGHSYAGLNDRISFALGLTALIALIWGTITAIRRHNPDLTRWLIITGLVLFFTLPFSLPIWQLVKPLQMIQFPWRLLSFTPITVPLVSFYLLLSQKKSRAIYIIIGILVVISLYFATRYSTPPYFQNNDQLAQQFYIHRDQTTTSSRIEMLPRWAPLKEKWKGEENLRVERGSSSVTSVTSTPTKIVFTAETEDPDAIYRIRRNYFPSWSVKDESGASYDLEPTVDGEINFTGSTGGHTYTVYVGSTKIEILANLISLLALIYLLKLGFR